MTSATTTALAAPDSSLSATYLGSASDVRNINFGVGNDQRLASVTTAAGRLLVVGNNPKVALGRVPNACTSVARETLWFGGYTKSGTTYNVDSRFVPSMAAALVDPYLTNGMDNVFANSPSLFTCNNIERVAYTHDPYVVSDPTQDGYLIIERGGNDSVKVAAVTAVDALGAPSALGPLFTIPTSGWGSLGFSLTTLVMKKDPSTQWDIANDLVPSQPIAGRFISASDLGVTASATVYGYVMYGEDVTSSMDLLGLTDLPTDTLGGGIDLLGAYLVSLKPVVRVAKTSIDGVGRFDFDLTGASPVADSVTTTTSGSPVASATVHTAQVGTAVTVAERVVPGYSTTWSCVDAKPTSPNPTVSGSGTSATIPGSSITLGADYTCSFTNTKVPTLSLNKALGANRAADTDEFTVEIHASAANGTIVSSPTNATTAGSGSTVTSGTGTTGTYNAATGSTYVLTEAAAGTTNLAHYSKTVACTDAAGLQAGLPSAGTTFTGSLTIVPVAPGAAISCTITNTLLPPQTNAVKTGVSVTGPTAAGLYTANYAVTVTNSGPGATTYDLLDTAAFSSGVTKTGASWTTSGTGAPAGGSSATSGPYTLAPAGTTLAGFGSHTYAVAITFTFNSYEPLPNCSGTPGTGLFNSVTMAGETGAVADNSTCLNPPAPPAPAMNVIKSVVSVTDADVNGRDAGDIVTYGFMVTNTGNVTLTNATVTDPLLFSLTCNPVTLAPGASATLTCTGDTRALTQAEVDAGGVENRASGTSTAPNGSSVADVSDTGTNPDATSSTVTAPGTVNTASPLATNTNTAELGDDPTTVVVPRSASIELTKSVSPTSVSAAGETVTYSFVVRNTGNVTLTNILISDSRLSGVSCTPVASLAPGLSATVACTGNTYTVTQTDIDNNGGGDGHVDNTATATGTAPGTLGTVTDTDTAGVALPAGAGSISVIKSQTSVVSAVGDVITYDLVVTNTGTVTVTNVTVTDPNAVITGGNPIAALAPGAFATVTAEHTVTQADVDAGGVINTATANGSSPVGPVTDTSDTGTDTTGTTITLPETVETQESLNPTDLDGISTNDPTITLLTQSPALSLGKVADVAAAEVGDVVTYTYTVTNSGNVTLHGPFDITDDRIGTFECVADPTLTSLAPTDSFICTNTYTVVAADLVTPWTVVNIASVTGVIDPTNPTDTVTSPPIDETVDLIRADLVLTKSSSPNPFVPGQPMSYTITVLNAGTYAAKNAAVTDTFPTGFTGISVTPAVDCDLAVDGSGFDCLFPTVATGETVTITVVGVTSPSATTLANTATVSSETFDPDDTNNTDTDSNTGAPSANLMVVKSDSIDPVVAGSDLSYTITVTNNGPSDAQAVVVTDTLPAGFTATSVSDGIAPTGCVLASPTVTCNYSTLAAGAAVTIVVVGSVDSNVADSGTDELLNTVTVGSSTPDPDSSDNETGEPTDVIESADLVLTKIEQGSDVTPGAQRTYTIRVLNAGPSEADGVLVTDTLPALLTFASATGAACTAAGQVVSCDLGTLTVGQQVEITMVVDVDPSVTGFVTNSATVTSDSPDPDTDNNTGTSQDPTLPVADLFVSKSAAASVVAGTELTYTIAGGNNGPSDAVNTALTDTLPAGTTFVTASSTACDGTTVPGTVTCVLGTLGAGGLFSIKITVLVAASLADGTVLHNVVTIGSDTDDPNPENNTDDENTPVNTLADIWVTKLVGATEVRPGTPIEYTVTVGNSGPSDAVNVVAVDTLPAGLTVTAIKIDGLANIDTCVTDGLSPETLTCSFGTISFGAAPIVVTLTVAVDPSMLVTLDNTVTVTTDTDDPDTDNNTDDTATPVVPVADLSIVKSGPEMVTAGTRATYTIVATNSGPSNALDVSVADTLPTQLTLVSAVPSAGGTCVDLVCTWTVVPAGAAISITLVVMVAADVAPGTEIVNSAVVNAKTPDPNLTNNTDDHTTTANTSADVSIVKRLISGPIVPGTNETYTLVITNNGPSLATDVVASDTLPAGLTAVSVSSTVGTCTAVNSAIDCQLGALAVGASVTVTLVVSVAASVAGGVVNTATVTSATPDPTPDNNTSTTTNPAAPSADVSVTKTAPTTVVGGSTFTYTLNVTNSGPSTAAGVSLSDTLPAGTTYVSASTGCSLTSGVVNCIVGSVAAGQSIAFEITVKAPNNTILTTLTNTGVVSATTPDPDPTNNASTVATAVTPADGTLTGIVWNDTDGDGVRDDSEVGLPGVTVTLTGEVCIDGTQSCSPTVLTLTTDANGGFGTALPPGVWVVAVVPSSVPVGMSATTATSATVTVPPNGTSSVSYGYSLPKSRLPSTGNDIDGAVRDAATVLLVGTIAVFAARRRRRRLHGMVS